MKHKILRPKIRAWENAQQQGALPGWLTGSLPPDTDIRYALRALRARSRYASQNDDHARHFLRLIEANVIGQQGISIQAHTKDRRGNEDRNANAVIEEAWAMQCERGQWDVTDQFDRASFDRLGVRTVAQDGEVLIRVYEGFGNSLRDSGFRVQLVDPETLDVDYEDDFPDGRYVRMGVEFDMYRRPIAYHLLNELPVGHSNVYSRGDRQRIPAEELWHIYLPEWIWQTRGVPWMSTALLRMNMLSGYEEAAITAARAAALKHEYYTQDVDAPPGELPSGYDDGTGVLKQDREPGKSEMLPPGWNVHAVDWNWPNTTHGEFTKECLRGIASGLGVAYNSLANDLESVNYSSLRQGALAERDVYIQLQDWWISWVSKPIYRRWVAWMVGQGKLVRPNGRPLNIDRLPQLSRASYQGRRWPWVDPLKDIKANADAVKLRTKSISDVIREQGRDPDEVWAELASDMEKLAGLGISPEDVIAQPEQTNANQED